LVRRLRLADQAATAGDSNELPPEEASPKIGVQ